MRKWPSMRVMGSMVIRLLMKAPLQSVKWLDSSASGNRACRSGQDGKTFYGNEKQGDGEGGKTDAHQDFGDRGKVLVVSQREVGDGCGGEAVDDAADGQDEGEQEEGTRLGAQRPEPEQE